MHTAEPREEQPVQGGESSSPHVAGGIEPLPPLEVAPPRGGTPRRLALCLLVAASIVVLDLVSKAVVFEWLGDADVRRGLSIDAHGHARHVVAGNWLGLMLNLNYGAAFGRLAHIPHLLVFGRVVAVFLLIWLIARAPRGQGFYLTSLVLILAGAAGNLYDNFFYRPDPSEFLLVNPEKPFGPVRDFIDVYFGIWDAHFPTFNVADSCISVGAVLLLLSGLVRKHDEPSP
jgi:signal peptidase II